MSAGNLARGADNYPIPFRKLRNLAHAEGHYQGSNAGIAAAIWPDWKSTTGWAHLRASEGQCGAAFAGRVAGWVTRREPDERSARAPPMCEGSSDPLPGTHPERRRGASDGCVAQPASIPLSCLKHPCSSALTCLHPEGRGRTGTSFASSPNAPLAPPIRARAESHDVTDSRQCCQVGGSPESG